MQSHPSSGALRENILLRTILVGLVALLIGIALFYAEGFVPQLWARLLDGVAIAVLTAAIVGLGYDAYIRHSTLKQTLELTHVSENLHRSGIQEVAFYQEIDWVDFFGKSRGDIDIFVTYGRSYAGTWASSVLKEVVNANRQVRVSLLDTEASPSLLELYAKTFQIFTQVPAPGGAEAPPAPDVQELRKRITDARQIWVTAAEDAKRLGSVHLKVEGIRVLLPFTFYRAGDEMWVVLNVARYGRQGGALPAIRCRKTGTPSGLYDWVLEDVGACRVEGRIVDVCEVNS